LPGLLGTVIKGCFHKKMGFERVKEKEAAIEPPLIKKLERVISKG